MDNMNLGTEIQDFGIVLRSKIEAKLGPDGSTNFASFWGSIYGSFLVDFAIENESSATTVHGIVKRYVDCICTLRIAQNYHKIR